MDFRNELVVAGFERINGSEDVERWEGTVAINWDDPSDGTRGRGDQRIAIELSAGFPFRRPVVRPLSPRLFPRTTHLQREGGDTAFCLWVDGQRGWTPWHRASDVLERVSEWLGHALRNDWGAVDRPPDLHLYYPMSDKPRLIVTGEDWPPTPPTQSGRFAIWRRNDYTLLAGAPTEDLKQTPSGAPPVRERLNFTSFSARGVNGVGYWYRGAVPPEPATSLSDLLQKIDVFRGVAEGATLRETRFSEADKLPDGAELLFFALGYPDTDRNEHWVFVHADRSSHRRNWRSLEALKDTKVFSLETAPATREALLRRTGHTARAVQDKTVSIFGVGAIGSSVALGLAKAGVPSLQLVDSDRLRPGNAIRHVAGLGNIGYLKHIATWLVILDHAPDCRVELVGETWDEQALRAIVEQSDVVVDATAVPAFNLLLNNITVAAGRPMVTAAAFHRAHIGRVRITRPGRDACSLCYEGGYAALDDTYPVVPQGDAGEFVESGCGTPTMEATAIDADAVASVAARAVLGLLRNMAGGEGTGPTRNHAIIVNEAHESFGEPFDAEGTHWTSWPPRADCRACGGSSERRRGA